MYDSVQLTVPTPLYYTKGMNRHCKCGETDPKKFYGKKTKACAKCHNEYTKTKGRENKLKIIQYLGGSCRDCGFNRSLVALDIHHLDPKIKDSGFRHHRYWSWVRIEKEIKNCILLCRNCHAMRHEEV
jgi:hypothetical protein